MGRKNKQKNKSGDKGINNNSTEVGHESKKRKQGDRDESSKEESVESMESSNSTKIEQDLQMQKMDSEIFELKDLVAKHTEEIQKLLKEKSDLKEELNEVKYFARVQSQDLNSLQQYTRKASVRVFGVLDKDRKEKAEVSEKLVMSIFHHKLGLDWIGHRDIEIAHRTKHFSETSNRPIIVKFISRKVKNAVIYNRRKLKGTKITIQEDLTPQNVRRLSQIRELKCVELCWSVDGKLFAKNANQQTKEVRPDDILNEHLFDQLGQHRFHGSQQQQAADRLKVASGQQHSSGQQTSSGPLSQQPTFGLPSQQPKVGPPSQQSDFGPPNQLSASGPPSQQPASDQPSQQTASGPPAQQPALGSPQQSGQLSASGSKTASATLPTTASVRDKTKKNITKDNKTEGHSGSNGSDKTKNQSSHETDGSKERDLDIANAMSHVKSPNPIPPPQSASTPIEDRLHSMAKSYVT